MQRRQEQSKNQINFDDFRDLQVNHMTSTNLKNLKNIKCPFKATCDFQYIFEQLVLKLNADSNCWFPGCLNVFFMKQAVVKNFVLSKREYKGGEDFTVNIKFAKVCVDFFGFNKERKFTIRIDYALKGSKAKFTSSFTIAMPEFSKLSELRFKSPGVIFPDPIIRKICKLDFKVDSSNSATEIELCIILEEFKLLPLTDRYVIYGYNRMLNLFLDIENSFELDLVQKCNLNNSKVLKMSTINYRIDTAGQIPKDAFSVCLTPMSAIEQNFDLIKLGELQISGPIVGYYRNYVIMEVKRNKKVFDVENELFHVEFRPKFFSSATAQRAIEKLGTTSYEQFILDFKLTSLPNSCQTKFREFTHDFIWMDEAIGNNDAQKKAIQNIVNRTSFPSPYVIFGPPGTGKTSTLVEAVAQIVKLKPNAHVLVTVNSNSACDEIGERLMEYVGANKMYRFYSPSFSKKMDRVNKKLKDLSNLKYGFHIQPNVQEILSYNVIITTLVNSARLRSIGATHFDWIFVDEAASICECFCLIPLSLSMKENEKLQTQFVLLGDHKQLGAIMRTYHNERFGFGISMMERVMSLSMYEFDEKSGYDPRYIFQLTNNFRSHHSILDYSNREFYNSKLAAMQSPEIANFAIGWKMLPNPEFPIIFHAVWLPSEMEGTSRYNDHEINVIRNYVKHLLTEGVNGKKVNPKDIGIISPYSAQRDKLKEIYNNGIEIGTVEYYQGREKLIIILSTVRSKTTTIGFLKNEKRLNVALTRAKSLLIVIGNPETLGKGRFWGRFISLCCDKGAVKGRVPTWVSKRAKLNDVDEENDADEIIRFEEMLNVPNMEE